MPISPHTPRLKGSGDQAVPCGHGAIGDGHEDSNSDSSAVRAAVERTVAELGRLDILVNNAGIFVAKPASIEREPSRGLAQVAEFGVRLRNNKK